MDENVIRNDANIQNENHNSSTNDSEIYMGENSITQEENVPDHSAETLTENLENHYESLMNRSATDIIQPESAVFQQQQNIRNPYIQNGQCNQYAQFRQYQQQYQQYNVKKKNKAEIPLSERQKKTACILKIGVVLIALIFVYCIISDIIAYKHYKPARDYSSSEYTDSNSDKNSFGGDNVVIYREGKPDTRNNSNMPLPDEDGKYTVEGIAAVVSQSIVQIAAFSGDELGSTGSGIILTEDGYILTNAHVVNGFDDFEIMTYDNEEPYNAELVGYDVKSDLAVMRIDTDGLIPAVIGYSDELNVGEKVVAIGNPAGLTGSVTEGIVSALGRQIRSGTTGFYMDCIQTDAAISPGNSGGALVNMYGQVVGVTSSKYASTYYSGTAYEGLGFAISIDQAMPIAEEIINKGYVSGRVRIGITFASLTNESVQEEFAANFNITKSPYNKGLWITEISPDCDIAKTELSVNDIILAVNGQTVNDYDDLSEIIKDCKAGDELTATCRRYTFGENKNDLKSRDFTIKFKLMEDTSGDF